MISDIMLGIKTKYAGSALATVLGANNLWDTKAPESNPFPYGTVQVVSHLNDPTFTEDMEFFRVQFNLITNDLNKARATTGLYALETALHTLFDDAILSVSGWGNTGMVWKNSMPVFSENNKVIGISIEYETYIFKSKS